jgi:hypothetical protein
MNHRGAHINDVATYAHTFFIFLLNFFIFSLFCADFFVHLPFIFSFFIKVPQKQDTTQEYQKNYRQFVTNFLL